MCKELIKSPRQSDEECKYVNIIITQHDKDWDRDRETARETAYSYRDRHVWWLPASLGAVWSKAFLKEVTLQQTLTVYMDFSKMRQVDGREKGRTFGLENSMYIRCTGSMAVWIKGCGAWCHLPGLEASVTTHLYSPECVPSHCTSVSSHIKMICQ